ncbi:MAG: ATP-binding cassette domain-containing protein, partial [Deltaproteobacteria bacterium]|nr:ATP-binding cassette domain-containing protein [Deltaproteobacteria bacterium]
MLQAEGLMVFYENMLALNNISLRCDDNQIVGVFGANSAGKSTLMYNLSGIILDLKEKERMRGGEQITVLGSITFAGEEISSLKPHLRARRGIVLCPE